MADEDNTMLRLAVMAKDGNVIVSFGVEITMMAMLPADARKFAESLLKQADAAEKEGGEDGQ